MVVIREPWPGFEAQLREREERFREVFTESVRARFENYCKLNVILYYGYLSAALELGPEVREMVDRILYGPLGEA